MRYRMWHAAFIGDRQITGWTRQKDKIWASVKLSGIHRHADVVVKSQPFFEPKP
jgi:hypothetical protein